MRYNNWIFKISISALAGFYMLFHGRSLDIFTAIKMPAFYIAFIVSFSVALLIVIWVHRITITLDKYYAWTSEPLQRMIRQLIFCVFIPVLMDFFLLSIYFYYIGSNIFENGFIKHDMPIIICFIVLLNFYYASLYLFRISKDSIINNQEKLIEYIEPESTVMNHENIPDIMPVKETQNNQDVSKENTLSRPLDPLKADHDVPDRGRLAINYKGVSANFDVKNDIVYFYLFDRKMYAITIHGREYAFRMTISELEELYSDFGLCRISRNVVVNCNMLRGYSTTPKRMVIVKPQFQEKLPKDSKEYFLITRECIEHFKSRFDSL